MGYRSQQGWRKLSGSSRGCPTRGTMPIETREPNWFPRAGTQKEQMDGGDVRGRPAMYVQAAHTSLYRSSGRGRGNSPTEGRWSGGDDQDQ